MTRFLRLTFAICCISTFGYAQQKYLYLENTITHKTKRLNLEHTPYLYLTIDSTSDFNVGGQTYTSYNPTECQFGKSEVTFKFSAYEEYRELFVDDNYYYDENLIELSSDSSVVIPYTNSESDVNLYLTRQTKFRRVLSGFGAVIFCAAIVNAIMVAPLIGMNNGSFNGYNWNRFARYELYSGIGIVAGITLGVGFLEREFYFQTQSGNYSTWKVVDSK